MEPPSSTTFLLAGVSKASSETRRVAQKQQEDDKGNRLTLMSIDLCGEGSDELRKCGGKLQPGLDLSFYFLRVGEPVMRAIFGYDSGLVGFTSEMGQKGFAEQRFGTAGSAMGLSIAAMSAGFSFHSQRAFARSSRFFLNASTH
jgi:hypothetical protein